MYIIYDDMCRFYIIFSHFLFSAGQARNLLSKWGQMEQESKQVKEYKPSGVGSKPTVTPLRPTSRVEVVNTEEYQEPQPEGGEFENNPVQRTDVVKESDP